MIRLKVFGLDRLKRKADAITRNRVIKEILEDGALFLQGWIRKKRLTGPRPKYLGVVTGRLRASIAFGQTERSGGIYRIRIGTNVEYAKTHEFGLPKRNIPARPFLRPALQEKKNQQEILKILTENIERALRSVK